ncbi:hypothetical protein BDP27DRAFT_638427 [Rhodocollybia butyracea]|uniref:BZIP domain-containing protein n=1 Tax=Rhodocollybia butyracea TaxID=206335 RepID=A0A9P5P9I8_9AGAR|nr:hypothetical protein BDP27DRAFT_638427 [Rhodocollybia butyracea]
MKTIARKEKDERVREKDERVREKDERVRENQRRSRERKREYVASLEARLAEYDKNGVQANIELQSKARAVFEENKILRKLLVEVGVSDAEIQNAITPPTSLEETVSNSSCRSRFAIYSSFAQQSFLP